MVRNPTCCYILLMSTFPCCWYFWVAFIIKPYAAAPFISCRFHVHWPFFFIEFSCLTWNKNITALGGTGSAAQWVWRSFMQSLDWPWQLSMVARLYPGPFSFPPCRQPKHTNNSASSWPQQPQPLAGREETSHGSPKNNEFCTLINWPKAQNRRVYTSIYAQITWVLGLLCRVEATLFTITLEITK